MDSKDSSTQAKLRILVQRIVSLVGPTLYFDNNSKMYPVGFEIAKGGSGGPKEDIGRRKMSVLAQTCFWNHDQHEFGKNVSQHRFIRTCRNAFQQVSQVLQVQAALPKKSLDYCRIPSTASLQGLKKTFWAKPFQATNFNWKSAQMNLCCSAKGLSVAWLWLIAQSARAQSPNANRAEVLFGQI